MFMMLIRNFAKAGHGGFLFFSAGLLMVAAEAQTAPAYTLPRGIYTVKVPGATDPGAPSRTYMGIQLLPEIRFNGRVESVSGNTLSMVGSPDLAHISALGRPVYLHVLDGEGKGFTTDIDDFRTNDLVCAAPLDLRVENQTRILIRPHPQLGELLGVGNPSGLGAGTDADAADNIVVWDPDAQHERVYYFHSTRLRWEEKGIAADAGGAIMRFPYGFYIVRRSPGTIRIALSGSPATHSTLLPVRPGANVFSLPINLLGSLAAIIRTDGGFPVTSGLNAERADILTFEEPTTGLQRGPFYHLSKPGSSGWREIGVNDSAASIQPLDFLSTLVLHRDGDAGLVLAEGSLEPPSVPRPVLLPDPEPGELPLTGVLVIPRQIVGLGSLSFSFEVSEDLQNWATFSAQNIEVFPEPDGDRRISFELPPGQRRAFYRLAVTQGF
jgi:hypothetical protein